MVNNALDTVAFVKLCYDIDPTWFTSQLRRWRNIKSRSYKKFKKINSSINFNNYTKAIYTTLKIPNVIPNPQFRWETAFIKLIKSFRNLLIQKGKVREFPSSMRFGGRELCGSKEIADMFADLFQSTYFRYSTNDVN